MRQGRLFIVAKSEQSCLPIQALRLGKISKCPAAKIAQVLYPSPFFARLTVYYHHRVTCCHLVQRVIKTRSIALLDAVPGLLDLDFDLVLLLDDELVQGGGRVPDDRQARADHRLAHRDEPVPATVLVLLPVRLHDVVLAHGGVFEREDNGSESEVDDRVLDALGVLRYQGKVLVEVSEGRVAEGVGGLEVGSHVGDGGGGVGGQWIKDASLGGVGEGYCLLAQDCRLVGLDGVGDEGIGGEVLQEDVSW